MRTQGSLRLILNTKLWPQMQTDKASEKRSRGPVLRDWQWEWVLIAPAPLHRLTHCSQDHLTDPSMDTSATGRILCRCY
uniref:Uncharacterized protein n=1 Tax=Salmo trutta TaxID=8032 RepID=A0A673WUU4_SALTR